MAVLTSPLLSGVKKRSSTSQESPPKRRKHVPDQTPLNGSTVTSDLFELQVEELLEILENESKANVQMVTNLLKQLKEAIEVLPALKPLHPKEADNLLKSTANVITPFPVRPPKDAQYTLEYAKPSAINVIGSAASDTLLSRDGEVVADLVVIMPTKIFQEKDYRNYRYFHKKAYYTACIAAGLQKSELAEVSHTFSAQNGNPLQPCLLIRQQQSGSTSFAVRILCVAPDNIFPPNKLLPWVNSLSDTATTSSAKQATAPTSPFYNSTLRAETLTLRYLALIHKVGQDMPAFRKASLLFAVWLHQRGLGPGLFQGGFGAFEARALMAVMLDSDVAKGLEPMFRTRYNHHQLFKATLLLLASRDYVANPALYNFSTDSSTKQNHSQRLQNASKDIIAGDAALLFDGTRAHNLFYKISPWAFSRLQRQAEITVGCLNGNDQSRFQHCFISKLDNVLIRYDQVMEVNLSEANSSNELSVRTTQQLFDVSKSLQKILRQALTDRALEISFGSVPSRDWAVTSERPVSKRHLQLMLVLDAKQATRLQDLGPSADQKDAAAAFREFWGSKAELRRFRDGSIQESVMWNDQSSESIVTQIVRYSLNRHYGNKNTTSIHEVGPSFWDEIRQPIHSKTSAVFEEALKSFRNLEQIIRNLKMPLTIRQISPASPALRYSLLNIDSKLSQQPIRIVVQFESSGQWPDDLGAIQQVKIAFLQKLADLLIQQDGSIQARVGLGQQTNDLFFRPFLEINFGLFCYHIILYHDRELVLLRSSPVDSFEDRKLVLPEIHYHTTMFLHTPAHTSRIRDLCTKHPLLSQAIRLFKSWCSAHLILSHFSEELLELFVVHVFTAPAPYGPPSSLRTAFLRTISMIAKWDWHNEPLFVKLSDGSDDSLIGQLNTHFEAWRKIDPSCSRTALLVGSTLDPTGVIWTQNGPSKMIAARLIALAKATISMVTKIDLELDSKQLFTPSMKEYDFVIHLDTKSLKSTEVDSTIVINSYTDELKRVFGDTLVWFHSGDSPKLIAGLWNPTVESKKWKVNLGYSTTPLSPPRSNDSHDGDTDITPEIRTNAKAILNEIVRLGGDLVRRVALKEGNV